MVAAAPGQRHLMARCLVIERGAVAHEQLGGGEADRFHRDHAGVEAGDFQQRIQQAKKDSAINEDQEHDLEAEIQTLTKASEGEIDDLLGKKTEEINTV